MCRKDNYDGDIKRKDKNSRIGDVLIGGGHPVAIQSMTNTRTEDVESTAAQIRKLEAAGCEIIRCAVPTMEAAYALKEIRGRSISHWLQTFILITGLQLRRSRTEQIRSGSTLVISGAGNVCRPS